MTTNQTRLIGPFSPSLAATSLTRSHMMRYRATIARKAVARRTVTWHVAANGPSPCVLKPRRLELIRPQMHECQKVVNGCIESLSTLSMHATRMQRDPAKPRQCFVRSSTVCQRMAASVKCWCMNAYLVTNNAADVWPQNPLRCAWICVVDAAGARRSLHRSRRVCDNAEIPLFCCGLHGQSPFLRFEMVPRMTSATALATGVPCSFT